MESVVCIWYYINMKTYDICIIGGGASGAAAAIAASRVKPGAEIVIIEKKETLGKKLAATGNGRCNITNTACAEYSETADFLRGIGIVTREEAEGRVYPYSGQASQVVSALADALESAGTEILCGDAVVSVRKTEEEKRGMNGADAGFLIETASGRRISARKLIAACGGKAAPQYGTSGDGYAWARSLGHTVVRSAPVLAPITLDESEYDGKKLKGIRAKCAVALMKEGKPVCKEQGEVQFTEQGVSGIAVFNLSRFLKLESGEAPVEGMKRYKISIDFMPDYSESRLSELLSGLMAQRGAAEAQNISSSLLRTIVDNRIAETVLTAVNRCTDSKSPKAGGKDKSDEQKIEITVQTLKSMSFTVTGTAGWKAAQCTAGGVALDEIDEMTCGSKIQDGLYFAGEIMDYDGPCGGFNLQHAWATGRRAGSSAARALGEPHGEHNYYVQDK